MQSAAEITNLVQAYASNPLLADAEAEEILIERCPFRRPTRTLDHAFIRFDRPLRRDEQTSNAALATHRLLLNIYESELLFLPDRIYEDWRHDMQLFYGKEHRWRNRIKTWNNIVEIGSKVYRQTRQSYLFDRPELACMLVESGFARVTEIPTPPELYEDLLRAERP